jgi:hypothetical protein
LTASGSPHQDGLVRPHRSKKAGHPFDRYVAQFEREYNKKRAPRFLRGMIDARVHTILWP